MQNQTPVVDSVFYQKETGTLHGAGQQKSIQAPDQNFSFVNHFKK